MHTFYQTKRFLKFMDYSTFILCKRSDVFFLFYSLELKNSIQRLIRGVGVTWEIKRRFSQLNFISEHSE